MARLSGSRLPSKKLVTSLLRNFASATGGATQKQIINISDWVSQVRQSAQEGVVDHDFWRSVINSIRGPLADKLSVHHCAVLLHALATTGHAEFECMTLLNGRILGELEAMGSKEGEVPRKEDGAAADSGKPDSEDVVCSDSVALSSSCMSVSDCRLIARASGQSRMYDSQVLDVVAGVLVSRLSELHAGQLLGFLSPPLFSALCEELTTRLASDDDLTAGSSRKRKPVTPLEAHRFIVSMAAVVDIEAVDDGLRDALRRCLEKMIKICLYFTTTQLDTKGCLQLMAALRKLKHYDEKFVNTRLLPTLNHHYMKSRAAPAGDDGLARVHEGATAMIARLKETIVYDVIEYIAEADLPSSDRAARELLSVMSRLMACLPSSESSAAVELWEASRPKLVRAVERRLPMSDSDLKRYLRICERVDDEEVAVLVKGDCSEALGEDLVTRGGMREVKSPRRSVAELFTYRPLHGVGNMNVAVHETEAQVLYDLPNSGIRSSCGETILRFSGAKIPLRTVLAQHVSTLESAPLKYLVNGRTVTECPASPVDIRTFLMQSGFELIGDTGIQAPLWQGISPQGVVVRICRLFNGRLDGQVLGEKGEAAWEVMRPAKASATPTPNPATLEE
ncbi:hypothetical protein FOZ62_002245, partial [Perkinsus olseni]